MSDQPYAPPLGERYSQLYVKRGEPESDSRRLRVRLGSFVSDNFHSGDAASALIGRLGVEIGWTPGARGKNYFLAEFFKTADLVDVLDAISVIATMKVSNPERQREWVAFAKAVMVEENVAYRVDEGGVVHPLIDAEFVQNIQSTLAGLDDARLRAVRHSLQAAFDDLEAIPSRRKDAIRSAFDAVETYVRLALHREKVPRLDANVINHKLLPAIQERLSGDAAAEATASRMAASLVDWMSAAHHYRHGEMKEEPSEPPLDIAVLLVSTAAAFLRWLVSATSHMLRDSD